MFATFFRINEDLAMLDQQCDCSCWCVDAVESTQTAMMEQVARLVERVDILEAHDVEKSHCICDLKLKVEQGEESFLRCSKALELLSSRLCWRNEGMVALRSGVREESSELEYASEDKEFRMPPPDLMTLVLEGRTYKGMFTFTIPF